MISSAISGCFLLFDICIKHAGDGGSLWKVFIGQNYFLCIDICFCCIYLKFSLLICYSSPSKYKLDRWFVKRFWRCWKVMTPSCSSTTFLLFVLLVGFALAGKKAATIIFKNCFRWQRFAYSVATRLFP